MAEPQSQPPKRQTPDEALQAPSKVMRDVAQRLLVVEAARMSAADPHVHEAVRVCEKLQASLTRLAGADGFTALLRRAQAMARANTPSLRILKLRPEDCMQELEALAVDATNDGIEAAVTIIAYLLDLLVTFIGEPLTLRLVSEAWPELSLDE